MPIIQIVRQAQTRAAFQLQLSGGFIAVRVVFDQFAIIGQALEQGGSQWNLDMVSPQTIAGIEGKEYRHRAKRSTIGRCKPQRCERRINPHQTSIQPHVGELACAGGNHRFPGRDIAQIGVG